ncbi:MAG: ABC transporter substrate-binding protein [Phycisphaerales bacterium]|jgi:oligopeptide transport system substrate-binding protein|nr:ABC transporter substrate-binding protein [Phycisphaeraceae bacterium]
MSDHPRNRPCTGAQIRPSSSVTSRLGELSRRAALRAMALAAAGVASIGLLAGTLTATAHAGQAAASAGARKVLQMPMRTDGPKSLDPAQGSTQYDNIAVSLMFETLLTFSYANPSVLEPVLLSEMPVRSEGGKVITFKLKPGVVFHDNACFPGGKGREITADDVFYSIKRLADKRNGLKNWWLLEGVIDGLDEYKDEQNKALDSGGTFNYDAPVRGFQKVTDKEFRIVLTRPVYRFLYTLAQFQLSIVPREAVEKYGDRFSFNPVGTGPFVLDQWEPKQRLNVNRNPNYHDVRYPAREAWSREDRRRRMDRAAGQRVPFVDRMEFTMFVQDQPMWLEFQSGKLGYIEVPNDYFEQAFDKRTRGLKPEMAEKGITSHSDVLLDFIFTGFNMADPVVGGLTPEARALRQALHLAVDHGELNEVVYQGINSVYDGPIPVGVPGHPEGGKAPISWTTPDLDRAKELLAKAGWPNGRNAKGEQLTLRYSTSNSEQNRKISDLLKRQIERLGVSFNPVLLDFSTLIENVNNKKAQMFGFAWGSDYPDAENNLALFYGPNESPGSNHYNYKNPAYDALYDQILVMEPSPERTKIYEQMRDMLLADVPYIGSMGRTRFYLMSPWIVNCRPTERTWSWLKYLDVDDSKRK